MDQLHETLLQPPQGKLIGRNFNGTVVLTSTPTNDAELQLYRVLQRASLLAYYDTLLEMGGDDVQQLCEAGEEEFLEIMALVGMASKPLHVRRLQKALQEWMNNPGMFRTPLVGNGGLSPRPSVAPPSPAPSQPPPRKETPPLPPLSPLPGEMSPGRSPGSPLQMTPILLDTQIQRLSESALGLVANLPHFEPRVSNTKKKIPKDFQQVMSMPEEDPRRMELVRKYSAIYGRFDCKRKPEKPLTLHEVCVNEAAAQICRLVPALLTRRDELFPLARQVVRLSGYHYSKGHSKSFYRPPGMNGDQPPSKRPRSDSASDSEEVIKRRQERLEQIAEELRSVGERTEGLIGRDESGPEVEALQARHRMLLHEQTLLGKHLQPFKSSRRNSRDPERPDTDRDTDSPFSFSNTSSPLHDVNDSRDSVSRECEGDDGRSSDLGQHPESDYELGDKIPKTEHKAEIGTIDVSFLQENNVQVLSSSGGNIIAVANPALSFVTERSAPLDITGHDPIAT